MRSRLARLAVATVGMLALLGGITPRAEATTLSTAAFVGTATLNGGLSFPCVGPSASPDPPTVDPLLCPWRKVNAHITNGDTTPTVLTVTLTLPSGHAMSAIPNGHVDFHHNRRTIANLAPIVCANTVENIGKSGKMTAGAGLCTFTPIPNPLNTVAGNCGLSGGQVVVAFTDATGNVFTVDVHFNAVGGTLILTGHVYKGSQNGKIFGVVQATPVPTTPDLGNSCARKTATVFTIVGAAAFATVAL